MGISNNDKDDVFVKGDDGTIDGKRIDSTSDNKLEVESVIGGLDNLGSFRRIQSTVRPDGITALPIDGQVTVTSTFGLDASPDTFFTIVETGSIGCQWTIDIAGVTDPTGSERTAPAFQKTFTIDAQTENDELAFRDAIITSLNLDNDFRNNCYFKAGPVSDRATIHIYSEKFSATGEYWERPSAGSFQVTIGGTPSDGVVIVGFDNIISRSKPVSIFRDVDSPHRLGSFSIFGNVRVEAKELSDLYVAEAQNAGSSEMTVNGSVTPVDFTIDASTLTDLFIESLIFDAQGSGIKYGNFLSRNQSIPNGLEITIKSDNIETTFPLIKTTEDFKNKFAALSGDGANFRLDIQAGADEMLAILRFQNPFILKIQGTYPVNDFIRVRVQDTLQSGISRLNFRAKGFQKEP